MDNKYKIELGVQLDTSGLQTEINNKIDSKKYKAKLGVELNSSDLKAEINKIDDKHKVNLGINLKVNDIRDRIKQYNTNSNNAKVKLGVKLDTKDLNQQIKKLSGSKGNESILKFNTSSLEYSLRDVETTIKDIKNSIGTLDGGDMKSLLSSINQINSSLDKTSIKFDSIVNDLKSLSGKDFSVNVGVKLGGSNPIANNSAYSNFAKTEVLPELKKQEQALGKYLSKYYKTNEFNAIDNLLSKSGIDIGGIGGVIETLNRLETPLKKGESIIARLREYQSFINSIIKSANMQGIDVSPVTSTFAKSADELVKSADDIRNGVNTAKDSMTSLKEAFGIDGVSTQLDSVVKDLGEIKTALQGLSTGASLEGLISSFNRLSETLEKLMTNAKLVQNTLGSIDTNNNMSNQANQAEKTADAYKKVVDEAKKLDDISIDISDGDVNDLKNALKNIKVDDTSIENATKELNEMNIVAKNVSGTLKDGNLIKWEIKGVQTIEDGLERVVTITKTLGDEGWSSLTKYSQALDKTAIEVEKINKKLAGSNSGTSKFDDEILNVETEYNKLTSTTKELDIALDNLKNSFEEIKIASAANDTERLIAANEKYINSLRDVKSLLKQNKIAEDEVDETARIERQAKVLEQKKQSLYLSMSNYLKDNSAAAEEFGDRIRKLQAMINACDDIEFNNLEREFRNIKKEVQLAGKNTQTFGDKLKTQFSKYSAYFSVAEAFMYVTQGLKDMFEQVKAIDSAMTELKKVTDETDASYDKFLTNAASRAKEIGTTIDGFINSTADFARLGYGFEDAQGLAEVANIYAVVGDEVEGVEGATESLISTMAAYKNEMNGVSNTDFAMGIIDKYNEIGNKFAITSGGIGEALERSASSLNAANNSMDESIALITAANTVVQDPDRVGNAFKTISMRIRGAKTE